MTIMSFVVSCFFVKDYRYFSHNRLCKVARDLLMTGKSFRGFGLSQFLGLDLMKYF